MAWYDRIALQHLGKAKGVSWIYVAVCSFVTYALSHNIGASVFSGGMVRYRAYTAKGLTAAEVAMLVALCSFTFAFGTILLLGLVLVGEPYILKPLSSLSHWFQISETTARVIGIGMLGVLRSLHDRRVAEVQAAEDRQVRDRLSAHAHRGAPVCCRSA